VSVCVEGASIQWINVCVVHVHVARVADEEETASFFLLASMSKQRLCLPLSVDVDRLQIGGQRATALNAQPTSSGCCLAGAWHVRLRWLQTNGTNGCLCWDDGDDDVHTYLSIPPTHNPSPQPQKRTGQQEFLGAMAHVPSEEEVMGMKVGALA